MITIALQTWATYPFNDYPTYSLLNGVLHPNGQSGVVPSDYAPTDGAELGFIVEVNAPTGAPIYCAVVRTVSVCCLYRRESLTLIS